MSKRRPSNAALTIVDVRVLDGVFERPRAAYAHENGERDRALTRVAHDPPPVFEDVDLYGVPGLRVRPASRALEEVRVIQKRTGTSNRSSGEWVTKAEVRGAPGRGEFQGARE